MTDLEADIVHARAHTAVVRGYMIQTTRNYDTILYAGPIAGSPKVAGGRSDVLVLLSPEDFAVLKAAIDRRKQ